MRYFNPSYFILSQLSLCRLYISTLKYILMLIIYLFIIFYFENITIYISYGELHNWYYKCNFPLYYLVSSNDFREYFDNRKYFISKFRVIRSQRQYWFWNPDINLSKIRHIIFPHWHIIFRLYYRKEATQLLENQRNFYRSWESAKNRTVYGSFKMLSFNYGIQPSRNTSAK